MRCSPDLTEPLGQLVWERDELNKHTVVSNQRRLERRFAGPSLDQRSTAKPYDKTPSANLLGNAEPLTENSTITLSELRDQSKMCSLILVEKSVQYYRHPLYLLTHRGVRNEEQAAD